MSILRLSIELQREAFQAKCNATKLAANYAALIEATGHKVTREEAMLWGELQMIDILKDLKS